MEIKLSEAAENEAMELLEDFKSKMKAISENVIRDFYCDILPHIETDSWLNYRNAIMSGFRNYPDNKIHNEYDFSLIRKEIFEDFKEEIIKDLNQDIYKENEELKKELDSLKEHIRNMRSY